MVYALTWGTKHTRQAPKYVTFMCTTHVAHTPQLGDKLVATSELRENATGGGRERHASEGGRGETPWSGPALG